MVLNTASCLCKKITIDVPDMEKNIGACHCESCRNWGGGPFLGVECGSTVSINSAADVTVYNSSEWAERAFCKHCGTHLYFRLKPTNTFILPIGLFNNTDGVVFDHEIFVDSQPAYYCFSNSTKKMTGQEVFDAFASQQQ